jgi:L-lactate utilization protein LutC
LITQFQIELEALGGEFIHCTVENLDQKIVELIQKEDCRRIWAWDAAKFPESLLDRISEHGIEVVTSNEPIQEMASIKIGLTGCEAAVAETGSLALSGGNGKPLLTSLLPEIHFAVLNQDQLLPTIEDLFQLPGYLTASAAALISGPSRTGDIELTLTIGVHGPKRVVVFYLAG